MNELSRLKADLWRRDALGMPGMDSADFRMAVTMSGTPSLPSLGEMKLPSRGVLGGVDHGRKRIGLAVTDANQTMAMPLTTLLAKSPAHNAQQFQRLLEDYGIVGWVLGLPLHLSGDESSQSLLVRKFGDWLAETTQRPVVYWDERLSSSAAEAVLWSLGETPHRDKSRIDGLAAQHILQTYLRDRADDSGESPVECPAKA